MNSREKFLSVMGDILIDELIPMFVEAGVTGIFP